MNAEGESITIYLEMRAPQTMQVTPPHRSGMLLRVSEPSVSFYRHVVGQLGGHLAASEDEAIVSLLQDDDYDVYVVYLGGVPAAMFELDRREPNEVELIQFGVLEGFVGRGLGKYVLASAIETAWQHGPERVWVRSNDRDDPRRILLLQWAGFVPYETTRDRPE